MEEATIKFFHRLAYVNFKNSREIKDSSVLFKKDFFACLEDIKEKDFTQIKHTTTKRKFKINTFALSEKGNYLRLTWRDKEGFHQRYTNFKDDSKNKRDKVKVFQEFKSMFKANNGVDLSEAFGVTQQYYKRCVPGLFHYDNPNYLNSICPTVGKLDFSSHFPACACGELPDAGTAKIIEGYEEPTEEYPFAFYIKSGFVAEYGKYNSMDWYYGRYRKALFESPDRLYPVNPNVDEVTVLMKASKYKLDEEMHHYYNAKLSCVKGTEEYEEAKIVLLKIVGMFEMNDSKNYVTKPYAHLAAIIKARAIYKMLQLIKCIGDNKLITVIVDGLLFNNKKGLHLGEDKEHIGSLKEEAYQAFGTFRGHNQYVLLEDGVFDIAHAGYDINVENPNMSLWRKSPAVHIKEMITQSLEMEIEDLNDKRKNH